MQGRRLVKGKDDVWANGRLRTTFGQRNDQGRRLGDREKCKDDVWTTAVRARTTFGHDQGRRLVKGKDDVWANGRPWTTFG